MLFICFILIAPVRELIINKGAHHLRLELALEQNKKLISRLPSYSSRLLELRKQGINLTTELTYEIKREIKKQQESRKSCHMFDLFFY